MAKCYSFLSLLLLASTVFPALSTPPSLDSDVSALLAFKAAADPAGNLATWTLSGPPEAPSPCTTWYGISCTAGRVTRVVLEGLFLSGTDLSSLRNLTKLRVLSLKRNSFSGHLPDLSKLTTLKLLFLSYNTFTGSIPLSLSNLTRLYRLDLSHNNLTGEVPQELAALRHLLTLRLDSNSLSGIIPQALYFPDLQDANFSSNSLSGEVPRSFSNFSVSAFSGNPNLCGAPLPSCTDAVVDPAEPQLAPAAAPPPVPPAAAVVSSSPGSKPEVAAPADRLKRKASGISRAAVAAIVAGDFAALLLVCGLLFWYFWRKFSKKSSSRMQEGEKIVYSSSPYASHSTGAGAGGPFERGRMVFLDSNNNKKFELEDLLRASAEMLGKGGHGTAYKAMLDDGSVVAVKRLRDVHVAGKREFENQMEILGRLRHPNLVPLIAYYYARDEKLLVYEFMPNGSLFSLLHGNRGPGRTPLDWNARMRMAALTARGLAYIHGFQVHGRPAKLLHGNLKSSNILVDKAGNARLADVGLSLLGQNNVVSSAARGGGGYRAPEATMSQKADVYSFGVVLLEMLTGRPACEVELPRWVASVVREEWTAEVFDLELMRYKGIEEELVAMLQLAMGCTAVHPDQRPKITHVLRAIEEIRSGAAGEFSPSHESFDSVSDSPSVSEDAAAH